MNVIAPRTLCTFWEEYPASETPLKVWLKLVQKTDYENFAALKQDFSSVDTVKSEDGSGLVVFNIGGNKFRLACFVSYNNKRVYIRAIMTHKQYDRWNKKGRPT